MKLSTKGRYGLRAMLDLALHFEEENVSIASISERQHISENYLEQLIPKLKKAGLVNSARGANGGYSLAKPMEEISVGDILRALEGELTPVDCAVMNDDGSSCCDMDCCVTRHIWKKISDSINEVVDKIFLKELYEDTKKLEANKNKPNFGC